MSALSLLCSQCRLGGLRLSSVSRHTVRQFRQVQGSTDILTKNYLLRRQMFAKPLIVRIQISAGQMRGGRTPVVQPEVVQPPPAWSDLIRPAVFSLLFTGGSLAGCAVWQYENLRRTARERREWWGAGGAGGGRKAGRWREELRQWWRALSQGDRLFWPLCGLNLLVFAAWRVPALQPFLGRWFLCGPSSPARCLPMILSAFSHCGSLHLLCNMLVLHRCNLQSLK